MTFGRHCFVLLFSSARLFLCSFPSLISSLYNSISPVGPITILRRVTAAGVAEAAATPLRRRFILRQYISTATSASAAHPQFDYDYYCYDDYRAEHEPRLDRLAAAPVEDSEGSLPTRELQLVFIGSPRSKKHLYAEKLSKLLAVPHISMASLVRQELSPRSFLHRQVSNSLLHFQLVATLFLAFCRVPTLNSIAVCGVLDLILRIIFFLIHTSLRVQKNLRNTFIAINRYWLTAPS